MGHRHSDDAALLAKAIALAAMAHGGQVDKAGVPYILHPLRVMLMCSNIAPLDGCLDIVLQAMMAAVLHDVVEDCQHWSLARLAAEDFPPAVVEAVDALSRREGEGYFAFVERAKQNEIAREVKLRDIWDNYLNPERAKSLRPELAERYAKAWEMLGGGREELWAHAQ